MKKSLIYLPVLALLGFAVWYFIIRKDENTFGAEEAGFTIKDTASIGRIFLASPDGATVLLTRTDTGWSLNNQYPIISNTIKTLLTTMHNQYASQPVAKASHNSVVNSMSGTNIKVEVYDREGRKMRTFYVGNEASKFNGTYMLMDGAKRPYVVMLDNFDGYVTPRYSTNPMDWRDRTVFKITPEEIQKVAINYVEDTFRSFSITRQGSSLSVTADGSNNQPPNMKRAQSYLTFFKNLSGEGYVNGLTDTDSLLSISEKRCTIDILTAQDNHHLDVYWMPINRRSKNTFFENGEEQTRDADRYYAIMNGGKDTMMIQQFVFRKVFIDGRKLFQADTAAFTN